MFSCQCISNQCYLQNRERLNHSVCLMAVNNKDENYFLPYLVSQDVTGVREETGTARGTHEREKGERKDVSQTGAQHTESGFG